MAIIKIPVITDYILVVDDDDQVSKFTKRILENEGEVDTVCSANAGLDKLGKKDYDLVVSDVDMPIMDGLAFYVEAKKRHPNLKGKFLFITGEVNTERLAFFKEHGINYFLKPFSIKDIRIAAKNILLLKHNPSSS